MLRQRGEHRFEGLSLVRPPRIAIEHKSGPRGRLRESLSKGLRHNFVRDEFAATHEEVDFSRQLIANLAAVAHHVADGDQRDTEVIREQGRVRPLARPLHA